MRLSHESRRTTWITLVALWFVSAVYLGVQTKLVDGYLDLAGNFGLRGKAAAETPLRAAYPVFAADAQTWVRHAINLAEGDSLRLRHTAMDNAPAGREVHWNSAWAWAIAASGKVHAKVTGKSFREATEASIRWLNPLVQWLLAVVLSAWTARRGGLAAGFLVGLAVLCKDRIYEGFFPSYADHHGLLTISVLGCVLGAMFMGAGWWRRAEDGEIALLPGSPGEARGAAVFSALSGAAGMWVSAASVIPAITVAGAAGLATLLLTRRDGTDGRSQSFDADAWRVWGRTGAAASFAFYLIEYFPNHLGLRLEANHPLYSLAWVGGSELIAQAGERWLGPRSERWRRPQRLAWPVALVLLAPACIALLGSRVFLVSDPFLARLHADYIQEFQPLWKTVGGMETRVKTLLLVNEILPALAGLAAVAALRRRTPPGLTVATFAALALLGLGVLQSRWMLNASAALVPVTLAFVGWLLARFRPDRRLTAGLALAALIYAPSAAMRMNGALDDSAHRRVGLKDINCTLSRDIADVIRKSQPQGEITLLSSPNGSTGIGYYGNFRTLGTLYWENLAGLRAAASVLAAKTDEEAAQRIRELGITHLALVSDENFISQYYLLLNPGATPQEAMQCFGNRVLFNKVLPPWLQILPYKVPDDVATLNVTVMLLKVNFRQTTAEAFYHIAMAQAAAGEREAAGKTLERVIAEAPADPRPRLRRAEMLLEDANWNEGMLLAMEAAALLPTKEGRQVRINVAGKLYRAGEHRRATQIYREALAAGEDSEMSAYLAWVLATSRDDSLRDGPEALRLAEAGLGEGKPATALALSVLSAALAECGRFPEAALACESALSKARETNDSATADILSKRLDLLRAGKPIRE